MCKAFGRGEEV
uniref:Uncharacterized protein n=1 Tax=Anguilla anguilla TaxID=7936 RepID=A0A0E9V341_ANGAN